MNTSYYDVFKGKDKEPMQKNRAIFIIFLMTFILGGLSACTTNPATGKRSFTGLMSSSAEKNIGAKGYQQITSGDHAVIDNQKLQAWINDIGQRLARHSERKDIRYTFTVLNSDDVNAFAMPGGYIYITRGLIAVANDESEVAAVLAHEMAHITARHSAQQYSHSVVTGLGAALLGAVTKSNEVANVAGLGTNLYLKSYSREHEHEADQLGLRYLEAEGYDPYAMARFLRSLLNHSNLQARLMGQEGKGDTFNYFSTHPTTTSRINEMTQMAKQLVVDKKPYLSGRNLYLKAVDGMLYGDSPEQGFIRGNDFIHTDLGFRFSVPDGYTLINTEDKVLAMNKAQDSQVVFDMAQTKQMMTPVQFIRNVWAKDQQKFDDLTAMMINGNASATASFDLQSNKGIVTVRLVAIQWDANRFYRFAFATPKDRFVGRDASFRDIAQSFRALTAKEKQSIRPYRLDVVSVKPGDTVASLVNRMRIDRLPREHFIVINGLDAQNPSLSGMEQVKIVVGN